MPTRTETRVSHCIGNPESLIMVHVPADLEHRAAEFAAAIAELMNELTGEGDSGDL